MDTKLTLKLEQGIIDKAKDYARSRKTSLSKLVETYLQKITDESREDQKVTPLVNSLTGIIKLPENFDDKNAYQGYLISKYK
jgi:hypothetical protein